jgi:hypothetical protein
MVFCYYGFIVEFEVRKSDNSIMVTFAESSFGYFCVSVLNLGICFSTSVKIRNSERDILINLVI